MSDRNRQPDLFAAAPQPVRLPTPEDVHPELLAMLATARAAGRMPWDAQRANVKTILFRQMANWLPEAERDELRAAFAGEMDRLRAAG